MPSIHHYAGALGVLFLAFLARAAGVEDSLDRDYAGELPRIPPKAPEAALETFELLPGLRLDLAAAEPLVRDPIALAFDEAGRLYVVEMPGYSEQRLETPGGVRLLEDTTGDGRYDKSILFAGDLPWATAILCYGGGVFVGAAPDLLFLKDTTGDGKADHREVVFTGYGLSNVQGLLNSLRWGLDNRVHGATSTSGAQVKRPGAPDSEAVTLRGRDFSFCPERRDLRPESGGGQYGMTFDAWGRKLVCVNDNHCIMLAYEDRYAARNPHYAAPGPRVSIASDGPAAPVFRISPDEPWRLLRTRLRVQGLVPGPIEGGGTPSGYFTSATGLEVYRGRALGPAFEGNLFVAEPAGNLVHRKLLEADGALLAAHRADPGTEFLRSTDLWFRPVQVANGPCGGLYIADMYREIVEHPDSLPPVIKRHLDLASGNDRGRIYRVTAADRAHAAPPDLGGLPSRELVPLLASRDAWRSDTAARLLFERQDPEAAPLLEQAAIAGADPQGRMRALYALDAMERLGAGTLTRALADADPRVREHALRIAEAHLSGAPELVSAMAQLAGDPDPRVRFQLAFSIAEAHGPDRDAALAALAVRDGEDSWMRAAILMGLTHGAWPVVDALLEAPDASLDFLEHAARLAGVSAEAGDLDSRLRRVGEREDGAAQALLRGLADGARIAGNAEAAQRIAGHPGAAALAGRIAAAARATLDDEASPLEARAEAVAALVFVPDDARAAYIEGLLRPEHPPELRRAALRLLGRYPAESETPPALIAAAWPELNPELRGLALDLLMSRTPWLEALLDAVERGAVPGAAFDSTRAAVLEAHSSSRIRARAASLLPARAETPQASGALQEEVLSLNGVADRGRVLFAENCAQCHRAEGMGHAVGPDLAAAAAAGPEQLLLHILEPNREVAPEYVSYIVETRDWEMHSGIIAAETAASVTLNRANGDLVTILRANIERIRATEVSLMPEGWDEALAPEQLADLLAYLATLAH